MNRCFILLLALVTASSLHAQPIPPGKPNPLAPTLNFPTPGGLQRGTTLELTLTGTNLAEPTGVWASFPAKITVPTDANNGKSPTSLRVKLEVPADAPLGFHSLRVATRKGLSNARLFCLDDLPQVMEAASNHDPKAAQPIAAPCVVVARADAEQTDYFKVPVKANQRLSFEVIGRRLGSAFDPQLTLLDAAGKELQAAHSNDAPGLQTDARLTYTFKAAGEVIVAIRDVSYRGGGDFHYRLRVGDFPCATAPLPLAIKRGTKAQVRFAGPQVDGVAAADVQAPADPLIESIQVAPKGPNGLHGWPVVLHLSDLDEGLEKEPNNDPKQAHRIAVPGAVTARFEQKDDLDHFVFAAKKGQRLTIEAHALEHLSPTEVYMVLKDSKGTQLQASNPMVAPKLDFTAQADGDYTLAVEHLHTWGGPEELYRLTVTPYQADFSLAVNLDRWELLPGGKVAVPIYVTRAGYGGPIEVSVLGGKGITGTMTIQDGPPKGAKGKAAARQPGQPAGTLTLSAEDVLAPGPVLFAIQGKATIEGKPVVRLAEARPIVAAAMGNLPVPPKEMLTQLGVAVLERQPFTLAVKFDAPESAPGKPVTATVTVTPVPGYKEEVALSFDGLPPGVKPELIGLRVDGAQVMMRVSVMLPASAKVGLVAVGTAKQFGRDWVVRSAPAAVVVKK